MVTSRMNGPTKRNFRKDLDYARGLLSFLLRIRIASLEDWDR